MMPSRGADGAAPSTTRLTFPPASAILSLTMWFAYRGLNSRGLLAGLVCGGRCFVSAAAGGTQKWRPSFAGALFSHPQTIRKRRRARCRSLATALHVAPLADTPPFFNTVFGLSFSGLLGS